MTSHSGCICPCGAKLPLVSLVAVHKEKQFPTLLCRKLRSTDLNICKTAGQDITMFNLSYKVVLNTPDQCDHVHPTNNNNNNSLSFSSNTAVNIVVICYDLPISSSKPPNASQSIVRRSVVTQLPATVQPQMQWNT